MSEAQPTLDSLAAAIIQAAKVITSYLDANNLPAPSFAEDSPASYPPVPEVIAARFQLLEALHDMQLLASGASDNLFLTPILQTHDMMTLDILNQFHIFSAVPLGGSATYEEIAQKTSLPESIVRRILRHAFTLRLFAEAPIGSGRIVHTAATAYAAKTPLMRSWLDHELQEARLGTFYAPESLRQYSLGKENLSEEITESGFAVADIDRTGHPTSYWEYLKHTPEGKPDGFRAKRFAEAMGMAAVASGISPQSVVKLGFDWASLGEVTVVDVGGSNGHDAIALAQDFPKLKFIVQDLPEVEQAFHSIVPKELATRISFQKHDFFTPQPTKADVFILKTILHDWPNKHAVKILQNLLPALKPGGRIIICDVMIPPTHDSQGNAVLPLPVRRMTSGADLQMFAGFNSGERTREDWEKILKQVDNSLVINHVGSFPGVLWSSIEVVLKD